MNNTIANWVVAVSAVVGAAGLILALVLGVVVAEGYTQVVSDRACVSALDGLRAQGAVDAAGVEMATLRVVAERYCDAVGESAAASR